ncbi:hypothetical protein Ocin01_18571 [Orchesella cincta]|uniref:Uncharacterized protein n=1 Tax=Orchesella cincta TaxID=48709 RepID=A0A1D2M5C7_ORCCI|nr:hypothetical protein Ocin01_18571 [Orchesella cincta]
MEEHQKNHIRKNLPSLIENTKCDGIFVETLSASDVLSISDVALLDSINNGLEKTRTFYKIIVTRADSYELLCKALQETKQTGAFNILNELPGVQTTLPKLETRSGPGKTGVLGWLYTCLNLARQLTSVVNNEMVLLIFENKGILDSLDAESIRLNIRTLTTSAWITQFCKVLESSPEISKALNLLLNLDNDPNLKNYRAIIRKIFEDLELPTSD